MASGLRQIMSASSASASVVQKCAKKTRLSLLNALVLMLREYERENSPHSFKQSSSARALSTISEAREHSLHLCEYKTLLKAQSYFERASGLVLARRMD